MPASANVIDARRSCPRRGLQVLATRLFGNPEDAGRTVFHRGLPDRRPGREFRALCLEGAGNVLQEDRVQHDVLVLGRVHVVALRVGGGPELSFDAEVGGGTVRVLLGRCHGTSSFP